MAEHEQISIDPAELDNRWAQWSRGVGARHAVDGLDAAAHEGDSDFRSYLSTLEQEMRGREAGNAPSAYTNTPYFEGVMRGKSMPSEAPSKTALFAAQAFAESEDADVARLVTYFESCVVFPMFTSYLGGV